METQLRYQNTVKTIKMKILITGGLGFIGINTAMRFAAQGGKIILFDNLNKLGSLENYQLLKDNPNVTFIKGDIRSQNDLERVFLENKDINLIFHLAAQTAVTTSLRNPRMDFESNSIGTFNLLECIREYTPSAKLIYTSTNKVYGDLGGRELVEGDLRYTFKDKIDGINEDENLDFYSPYGCSKGSADQYVRDYHRIYGLDTVVVRQSCIYGDYQNGTEDQGWVAWFIKRFIENGGITIFGDGKQVRDILYIDDLVDFYQLLVDNDTAGEIYNIGGGMENSVSIKEIMEVFQSKFKDNTVDIGYDVERDGDQKIFISDNSKAETLGWRPKVHYMEGIDRLISYLKTKV